MSFGDLTRINTNVQSLRAYNQLQHTNSRLNDHQLRLATGKRINEAADDSAGFALSKKLEARIRGQRQAQANIGDAQSMLTVAESATTTMMDIVQSMKEKVVQARNDSMGDDERDLIQGYIDEMALELQDLADHSEFNGVALLNGTAGTLNFQVGAGTAAGDVFAVEIPDFSPDNGDFGDGTVAIEDIVVDNDDADRETALGAVDGAIDFLSAQIAKIGDAQNRLSFKEQNLATSTDNYEAAKSRIMDADFAKEQMELVKQQILQETGNAALAQSNAAPQSVLSLLQ
ncbi:MAG: flagellin [Bacteroidetes bacterium]|jgi:flagellin|nr:flagellin [Bacteroidota bacterium]